MNDIQDAMGEIFNPNNVEPEDGFKPVPPGWYPATIERAEVRETKAGTGNYLSLQFSILGNSYGNRKVFTNINLKNPNKTCEDIGHRELASLCLALRIAGLQSSDELLNKDLRIKVKVTAPKGKEGEAGYREPENDIDNYRTLALEGGAPATPAVPPEAGVGDVPAAGTGATTEPATPSAGVAKKMPWDK